MNIPDTLRQIARELHDAGMTGTWGRITEVIEEIENTMNPPDTPIKTTDWMSGEPLYSVDTVKALEKERDAAQTRIAELEEQLGNEQARGVHTCHDGCERPLCKANRELRAAVQRIAALETMVARQREALRLTTHALPRAPYHPKEIGSTGQIANDAVRSALALTEKEVGEEVATKGRTE